MDDDTKVPRTQRRKARGNGSGTVFHVTSAGRWRAQITWTDEQGRVHRKSRDKATQREAQEALRALLDERDRMTPGSDMKVSDWFTLWLADEQAHVRSSTFTRYQHVCLGVVGPRIGHFTLGELTPRTVERLCDDLTKTYATTTVALAKTVLGISLKRARRDGFITGDPVGLARPVKAKARPVEMLSPEQTKTLLAAAREDHVVGPLVTLLVATGARIGEIAGLQMDDLDLDRSRLHIRRTMGVGGIVGPPKSARGIRTVTLPDWATDVLRDHIARQRASTAVSDGPAWLLRDDYGRPWSEGLALARFHMLLKHNGLPKVRLHSLRHAHATHLLDAGVDLLSVSRRLGHSSPQITASVYTGTLERRDEELATRLESMLGG